MTSKETRTTRRFNPGHLTRRLVPVVLGLLLLALLITLMVIVLSILGLTPAM